MQRIRHRKASWLFSIGLLLFLLLQFWFPTEESTAAVDTFSVASGGKKAFYTLLQENGLFTRRATESLADTIDYQMHWYGNETLVLLGSAKFPEPEVWKKVLNWTAEGGTLIYAAPMQEHDFTIPQLGINVLTIYSRNLFTGLKPPIEFFDSIETALPVEGKIAWPQQAELELPEIYEGKETVLVKSGDSIQAVEVPHADGRIILVATDLIFSNASMMNPANAELAFRLFEQAGMDDYGTYWFDEWLNVSSVPKILGLLINPTFRPLTMLILMLIWLYLWSGWFRFGPYLPETESRRRSIVAHSNNIGTLYYKHHQGAAAVSGFWKQFQNELNWRHHKRHQAQLFERLAIRTGKTAEEIQQVITQAEAAESSLVKSRGEATRRIEQMAELRGKLLTPGS